jgi:hypothetical protein
MVTFSPRATHLWESVPLYPLHKGVGEPQSESGSYEDKKSLAPAGNRTPITRS